MRKSIAVLLILGVAVGGLVWLGVSRSAQADNDSGLGFGKRIAGTWFYDQLEYSLPGNPDVWYPFPDWRAVQTINADGTYVVVASNDVNVSEGLVQVFGSANCGNWHRTGQRDAQAQHLSIRVDGDGELVGFYRSAVIATFSRDFDMVDIFSYLYRLGPDDDPVEDDGTLYTMSRFRGRRLAF